MKMNVARALASTSVGMYHLRHSNVFLLVHFTVRVLGMFCIGNRVFGRYLIWYLVVHIDNLKKM